MSWRSLVVLALAAALYFVRIGAPSWGSASTPSYLFDERYTAFTAHRIVTGDPTVLSPAARRFTVVTGGQDDLAVVSRNEWSHPPGAPIVLALFVAVFGYSAAAVRSASALAALVTLAAVARLAGPRRAWLACALLALDGAFFVFARVAMPHMLLVAAQTLGVACAARVVRGDKALLWASLAGACFGFATSVRWTALPVALAVGVATLFIARRRRQRRLALVALVFAALAGAAYLAAYVPFLVRGLSFGDLVVLHRKMIWFHTHLPTESGQSQPWYVWPWTRRGVVLGAAANGTWTVWCSGGRLLWWALVPATARVAWRARASLRPRDILGVVALATAWAPWALLNRFGLSYYLLPALPFAAIFVADALVMLRRRSTRRWALRGYAALALALFVASYPALAAVPVSPGTLALLGTMGLAPHR